MNRTWEEFKRFEENMNRLFENFLNREPRFLLPIKSKNIVPVGYREPYLDLKEDEKEIIARIELPGLNKDDIKINISDDMLEISAETKHEEKKDEEGYIYRERYTGSYYRSISLPSSVDSESSKASYENGILKVTMPKTEIKKKKLLKID